MRNCVKRHYLDALFIFFFDAIPFYFIFFESIGKIRARLLTGRPSQRRAKRRPPAWRSSKTSPSTSSATRRTTRAGRDRRPISAAPIITCNIISRMQSSLIITIRATIRRLHLRSITSRTRRPMAAATRGRPGFIRSRREIQITTI